jgi:hypothetical protein
VLALVLAAVGILLLVRHRRGYRGAIPIGFVVQNAAAYVPALEVATTARRELVRYPNPLYQPADGGAGVGVENAPPRSPAGPIYAIPMEGDGGGSVLVSGLNPTAHPDDVGGGSELYSVVGSTAVEAPHDIYAHTEKPVDANNVYDPWGGGGEGAAGEVGAGDAVYDANAATAINVPIEYAAPLEDPMEDQDGGNYAEMAPKSDGNGDGGGRAAQSDV